MNQRDQQIIEAAMRQHGVVSRRQLASLGLSPSAISRRRTSGFLVRLCGDAFVVQGLSGERTTLAAALLSEPMAVASHFTAAELWHLRIHKSRMGPIPEVTIPRRRRPRLAGVTVHTSLYLPESHTTETDGVRVTTAERTLADTGYRLRSLNAARYAIQRAIADSVADPEALTRTHLQLARQGRNGTVFTRLLYDELLGRDGYPSSELEIRTQEMLLANGLFGFVSQFRPPWYEGVGGIVDFAKPEDKLIIEVDGRRWHAANQAQREDRRRDRVAVVNGWIVIRFTWADVMHDPETLCSEIRAILSTRQAGRKSA